MVDGPAGRVRGIADVLALGLRQERGGEPTEIRVRARRSRQRLEATVIGEVTDGERLEIFWHGEQIVDVPPRTVAHEGQVYQRPYARPDWQDALQADDAG